MSIISNDLTTDSHKNNSVFNQNDFSSNFENFSKNLTIDDEYKINLTDGYNSLLYSNKTSYIYHNRFPNLDSDVLVYLSMWQYWWWFWFFFLTVFYFLTFFKIFSSRQKKMNPKINTSLKSHGRWGDFIVGALPIYWCLNILTNSNSLLKMMEWQTESNIFTLRIRGKQWYWVYKFDMSNLNGFFHMNKNVGNNYSVGENIKNTPSEAIFKIVDNLEYKNYYKDSAFSAQWKTLNFWKKKHRNRLSSAGGSMLKFYLKSFFPFEVFDTRWNKLNKKSSEKFNLIWSLFGEEKKILNKKEAMKKIHKNKTKKNVKILKAFYKKRPINVFRTVDAFSKTNRVRYIKKWEFCPVFRKKLAFLNKFYNYKKKFRIKDAIFYNLPRLYVKGTTLQVMFLRSREYRQHVLLNPFWRLTQHKYKKIYWTQQTAQLVKRVSLITTRNIIKKRFLATRELQKQGFKISNLKNVKERKLLKKLLTPKITKKSNFFKKTYFRKLFRSSFVFTSFQKKIIKKAWLNNFFYKPSFLIKKKININLFLKSFLKYYSFNIRFRSLYKNLIVNEKTIKKFNGFRILMNLNYIFKKDFFNKKKPIKLMVIFKKKNGESFWCNFEAIKNVFKKINEIQTFNASQKKLSKNIRKYKLAFAVSSKKRFLYSANNSSLVIKKILFKSRFNKQYFKTILDSLKLSKNFKLKRRYFFGFLSRSGLCNYNSFFFNRDKKLIYKSKKNFINILNKLKNLNIMVNRGKYTFKEGIRKLKKKSVSNFYLSLAGEALNKQKNYHKDWEINQYFRWNINSGRAEIDCCDNEGRFAISFNKKRFRPYSKSNHIVLKTNRLDFLSKYKSNLIKEKDVVIYRFKHITGVSSDTSAFYNLEFKKNNSVRLDFSSRLLKTDTTLVLPSCINIAITTNSFDVVHSWFVPGLGIKMDCVPGRTTHHTFCFDIYGVFYGQCAEVCGRFHHHMPIKVAIVHYEFFVLWFYHIILFKRFKLIEKSWKGVKDKKNVYLKK